MASTITINEATMEQRKALAGRIHRLNSLFTMEYLEEVENMKKEQEAVRKMKENAAAEPAIMVLTADWNAKVNLDCMKDCMDVVKYLSNEDEVVYLWQMAGINAMLDQANADKSYDYSLPTAISDVLGIRFMKK